MIPQYYISYISWTMVSQHATSQYPQIAPIINYTSKLATQIYDLGSREDTKLFFLFIVVIAYCIGAWYKATPTPKNPAKKPSCK